MRASIGACVHLLAQADELRRGPRCGRRGGARRRCARTGLFRSRCHTRPARPMSSASARTRAITRRRRGGSPISSSVSRSLNGPAVTCTVRPPAAGTRAWNWRQHGGRVLAAHEPPVDPDAGHELVAGRVVVRDRQPQPAPPSTGPAPPAHAEGDRRSPRALGSSGLDRRRTDRRVGAVVVTEVLSPSEEARSGSASPASGGRGLASAARPARSARPGAPGGSSRGAGGARPPRLGRAAAHRPTGWPTRPTATGRGVGPVGRRTTPPRPSANWRVRPVATMTRGRLASSRAITAGTLAMASRIHWSR